jgi:antitoxin ParD1/3/4
MTAKTSISLTDVQEAYAKSLVERGKYPSLSAVLQHGLELLRVEKELEEAELTALRALLKRRDRGTFVSGREGRKDIDRVLTERKKAWARRKP